MYIKIICKINCFYFLKKNIKFCYFHSFSLATLILAYHIGCLLTQCNIYYGKGGKNRTAQKGSDLYQIKSGSFLHPLFQNAKIFWSVSKVQNRPKRERPAIKLSLAHFYFSFLLYCPKCKLNSLKNYIRFLKCCLPAAVCECKLNRLKIYKCSFLCFLKYRTVQKGAIYIKH